MRDAQPSFRTILFFSVFVGLLAVLGAFKALQATGYAARMSGGDVVVAVRDIPEGSIVGRDAVKTMHRPAATVPAGTFRTIDSVVGRVTRVAVLKGEPMSAPRLAPAGSSPGLQVIIAPGKRAMVVRIDDAAVISGLIQPNSRVDVLVTLRADAAGRREIAKVFMENMRVLSVGRHAERGGAGEPLEATTATLEVAPDEAERLALAMNSGTIELVVRGYGDRSHATTNGASSADVLAQLRQSRPDTKARVEERRSPSAPRAPATAPTRDSSVGVQSAIVTGVPEPEIGVDPDSSDLSSHAGSDLAAKRFKKSDSAVQAARKP